MAILTILIRKGLQANRSAVIPAEGELIYSTDGKCLAIGDGINARGIDLNGVNSVHIRTIAGDLSSPVEGDVWVNSTTNTIRIAVSPTVIKTLQ